MCFTSDHMSDIAEVNTLLHGQETVAFGDAGYRDVHVRPSIGKGVQDHRASIDKKKPIYILSTPF
jgi:IS5 family transposase